MMYSEKNKYATENYHIDNDSLKDVELLCKGVHHTIYSGKRCLSSTESETYVSVPIVLRDYSGDDIDVFRKQVDILKDLKHDKLIKFVGVSTLSLDSKHHEQIVLEKALGGTLRERIENYANPLSVEEVLTAARDIADVMKYLHTKKIRYRGLSTKKIFLRQNNTIALTPCSQSIRKSDIEKKDWRRVAEGVYNSLCDVYSYGMVLIEMLLGKSLNDLEKSKQIKYLANGTIDVDHVANYLPHKESSLLLFQIARRCLKEKSKERLFSFKVIHEELEELSKIFLPSKSFEDVQKISDGTHANISKARYEKTWVALKDFCGYNNKAFHGEFLQLKKLKHKNIVRLLGVASGIKDIESIRGEQLVLEYCSEGSLAQRIKKPFKFMDRIFIARDIAEGMEYLHSKELLHRNLCSSNILVKQDGTAVICDFRMTIEFSEKVKEKFDNHPRSAPEMTEDEGYDLSSDVYSFGMLLLELASGKTLEELTLDYKESGYVNLDNSRQLMGSISNDAEAEFLVSLVKKCVEEATSSRLSFPEIVEEIRKNKVCAIHKEPLDPVFQWRNDFYEVYKAHLDTSTVNIFIFVSKETTDKEVLEKELPFIVSLKHENIIQLRGLTTITTANSQLNKHLVYDCLEESIDTTNSGIWPITRVLEGNRHLKKADVIKAAKEISSALNQLHINEKTHKRLTNYCIFMSEKRCLLIDLAVASISLDNHGNGGSKLRTPPEERRKEENIDEKRADVYRFGVLFCELIFGKVFEDLKLPIEKDEKRTEVIDFNQMRRQNRKLLKSNRKKLYKFAIRCLNSCPINRPTLKNVIEKLDNTKW
ncbi:dual specificity protein kinase pyk3-like [Artemia franciscana]|uniref:Protein kinase domain-containing protein n=1 Tax=Artemia franciscana TaxID=6661 RepID=A0AA88I8A9_ARTSF|nr:hypothetical protein QYM36_001050 [Artemia franciscana]